MKVFEEYESQIRGYCRSYPTVFSTASNARQTDEQGKTYIDFFAGAGVLNFGHNNPHMKKAVIEYLQNDGVLHSLDMYTTAKRSFIKKFAEIILKPRNMDHKMQFMGPTGTNAVEAALKLARRVTGRGTIVAFTEGFHGMTLGALACTANSYFRDAAGVPLEHVFRAPFNRGMESLKQLRAQFEDPSSERPKPAAFILEAIQAEGGVHIAEAEWLQEVQSLARDLGSLLIIDDIQAGCGRTGSYFSFDGIGLDPDIITLAKGLGGIGTPIAMNLVKPEYDAHWKPAEHTGTFRGQNISFIAGAEALRYFENDELMDSTRRKGAIMRQALEKIATRFPERNLEVRGKGMMQALDLGDGSTAKAIASACFSAGLLVGPCGSGGKVIKLIPPLTIPDDDLKAGLDIFTQAVVAGLEAA
ncbi:diaminobutyrate--2-oxoglutarate transaminase [Spirochaeta dissipatitropha]